MGLYMGFPVHTQHIPHNRKSMSANKNTVKPENTAVRQGFYHSGRRRICGHSSASLYLGRKLFNMISIGVQQNFFFFKSFNKLTKSGTFPADINLTSNTVEVGILKIAVILTFY